ncbi:uncharacterized protein N0V89_000637 [Didymosphaeria variabile]|uniref:Pathway-specific nitrogen regulator n=1 Tax=Didymosphaeria variabile TaxID=1932322 RepID=A0A9W9CF46_9PLEO|nr:uncharacterized protein N0V89_000637 [Didymosphaeria variabile]KAJ4360078.1 hypothetical protein N0V89_000637 [Didymosphaeria variabile]
MTTIHHSPPPGATPFAIYEDPEDQEPPSPSEEGDVDVSFTSDMSMSGADVAIPSIETERDLHDEPEPYNGSYTSRSSILSSSRRDSTMTDNSFVSSLPSEISVASKPVPPADALESRYSPRKERPPFRNPSSVRAMQMASPVPSLALEAPRERTKGSYKLATPSRSGRSDSVSTTGTRRSRSHRDSMHRENQAQRPSATPQPLPLVLLHVTILPMQMPYTPEIMIKIMPEWLVENYKVLEEKLQDIVLMRRGLLIQHPRDEYDVLEERILESLELKTPRLLKCGHFVAPDSDDEESDEFDDERRNAADDGTGRGSRMSGGTVTAEEDPEYRYPTPNSDDAGVCLDCHRQVKKPGHGVGAGTKRWDIKIYAANGLMRAGAWIAAWSEMERCDVEISPWIPHEVRKTLDKRLQQEEEAVRDKALYAAELQRQMEAEATLQRKLEEEAEAKQRAEETELQIKIEAETVILQKKLNEEAAGKRKLEETLTERIEEAKEAIRLEFEARALMEANGVADRFRAMEDALKAARDKAAAQAPNVVQVPHIPSRSRSRTRHRTRSRSRRPRVEEIPLGTLLKNYFVLQLQDSRNFFILILGALVVFLLTNSNPNWNLHPPTLDVRAAVPLDDVAEPIVPAVVTSTATMTATSFSTLVVIEVQTSEGPQETLSPASSGTTVLEEAEPSTSQPSMEEPNIVTILPAETEHGDERADSVKEILEEPAEQAISEEDDVTTRDQAIPVGNASGYVASSEPPMSTAEAPSGESFAPSQHVLSSYTVEEPDVEEPIPGEPATSQAIIEDLIAEEPTVEPFEIEQADASLGSALPEAESLDNEDFAEAPAQHEDQPETEAVPQVDEAPNLSGEDASAAAHEIDEL